MVRAQFFPGTEDSRHPQDSDLQLQIIRKKILLVKTGRGYGG
jgi:hypothetical protein